jgi:hypothetical protein
MMTETDAQVSSILATPELPLVIVLFSKADHLTQMKLATKLTSFSLSVRATNVLKKANVLYLGELICLRPETLMRHKNSGRKTVQELSDLANLHGFQLGTSIPDWSREVVITKNEMFSTERIEELRQRSGEFLDRFGPKPMCLEQELERIARALEKGRNAEMIIKLWGWSGQGPRTLDSVGKELILTRERVRQIEARALKRLRSYKFEAPFLKAAIAALHGCVPISTAEFQKELVEKKITKAKFSVAGIKRAAEHLSLKWSFESVKKGSLKLFVSVDDKARFDNIMSIVRRRTSELGCLNILSLAAEVRLKEEQVDPIRTFLNAIPGIEWLDDDKQWFFLFSAPRNRLINLCIKVLSISPTIRLAELRRAVMKCRRLVMAPPQKILSKFIQCSELGRVEDGIVVGNPEKHVAPDPDSAEGKLIRVLNEYGPVMDGEELADKCITSGMNPITFYIYRMNSPVVSALGKGIYCKVGTEIPPGTIESIVSRRRTTPRVFDHGWTPKGSLWCGIEASRSVIMAGSIALPNFVADLVQGEWQVRLPDGEYYGSVTCKNAFIWSFRRAFLVLGLEPHDLVAFEFNLREHTVTVKAGGAGLFESIQDSQESDIEEAEDGDQLNC